MKKHIIHWIGACMVGCASLAQAADGANSAQHKQIESVVREYYDRMEALDVPGMREMSTDEFEILDRGYRYGWWPFEQQLHFGKKIGLDWKFVLQDFRTVVIDDVAYTSYVTIRPGYKYDGLDALILKRRNGRWLVDRFVHMRMVDGTDPHRVPGGQKNMEKPE